MAGSINLSLSQQFNALGEPLAGGQLFFYAAGTTTPQNAFYDSGLTLPYPYPITLDAAGRIPPFFLADGSIKIRLTDRFGVVQVSADNLVVVGPSSGGGGGGGGTVDPTTVLSTGDLKFRYGVGTLSGFVRLNARSIGSLSSGATERANTDTQSLFIYLWNADATLAVSGGRGASATADYAANKNITLPDWRGRLIGGLDDMGNTASGRLTTFYYGSDPTVLGAAGGAQTQTLDAGQLPAQIYPITGNAATITVASTALDLVGGIVQGVALAPGGSSYVVLNSAAAATQAQRASTGSYTPTGTVGPIGNGNPHPIVPPAALATFYCKL